MRLRTAALPMLLTMVALVAGCSSSGSKENDVITPPPAATSTNAPAPSTSAAPSSAPVAVNKSFTDPTMGESGTVLKYVRNFPVPQAAREKYALDGKEIVLVQMTVHSSSKYHVSLGEDRFNLLGDGNVSAEAYSSDVASEMTAAGYPPIKDAETGKSSTGWLAFAIKTGSKSLSVQYYSLSITIGNKTVPAKAIDIKLG